MAALGFALSKQVAKLTVLPIAIMAPIIVTLCSIGSFAIRKSFFDVILMAAFGLLGFFMRKGGFATAPMVLGLILSDHLESYFRRALILARGDIWATSSPGPSPSCWRFSLCCPLPCLLSPRL